MNYSSTLEIPAAAPPVPAMLHLLFGKHITYSLSAVARLGVADHIREVPVPIRTLAQKVAADSSALYRVLRLLAGAGVFEEWSGKRFSLSPLGELLRTDAAGSLRFLAIQLGDTWSTRPLEHFTDTLRTGIDGVTHAFGKNAFELLAEQPEQAEHFNRSMSGLSAGLVEPIVNGYDFSSVRRLADVGGGHGALLAAILGRNPSLRGVLYDLPEVVAGASGQPHFEPCSDRIQVEGGSFFARVPENCDAYMLKFILHDWSDFHCTQILERIRQQLPPQGRVLVIEQLITDDMALSTAKLIDIEMLALTVGGRERTASEFAELFSSAGLELTKICPTNSPVYVLEARIAS